MDKLKTILFVCTGNTCRSSMAEGLFKKMLKDAGIENIKVSSAGTSVFYTSGAAEQAVKVMSERDIDLTAHKSKQVDDQMIKDSDLILTMTKNHREALIYKYPEASDRIFTLKEFVSPDNMQCEDICDPFGLSVEQYRICADDIQDALEKLIKKIDDI